MARPMEIVDLYSQDSEVSLFTPQWRSTISTFQMKYSVLSSLLSNSSRMEIGDLYIFTSEAR